MRERRRGVNRERSPRGQLAEPPSETDTAEPSAAEALDAAAEPEAFERFVVDAEPRLRRALVAAYGPEAGRDAAVDALAWAWSHWARVQQLHNPVGYLYRVGQTKAREARNAGLAPAMLVGVPGETLPDRPISETRGQNTHPGAGAGATEPWFEPGLDPALRELTEHQRVAVVLCHGFQWTHREVAGLLELSTSSVQNHVERGLAKLRRALEVNPDA